MVYEDGPRVAFVVCVKKFERLMWENLIYLTYDFCWLFNLGNGVNFVG